MNPYKSLLTILVLMLSLIIMSGIIMPMEGLTGANHPEFPGMKVSPFNTDQYAHTKWMGYALAILLIALFVNILYVGSLKKGRDKGMGKYIFLFGIVYTVVFSMMIFSNWVYVSNPSIPFFGQMPRPTAWMIYVVWLSPLILTFAYVFGFDRWIISREEEEELVEWLEGRK